VIIVLRERRETPVSLQSSSDVLGYYRAVFPARIARGSVKRAAVVR
jgi:hypothetical protein